MTLVGQQEDKQAKSLIKPFIQLYYYVFNPNKYHVNHPQLFTSLQQFEVQKRAAQG